MAEQPQAVYHQASFLSGEWSPLAQGRSDVDAYKAAMNLSLNGFPVIEGAWARRSGTQYLGPTIGRTYSKLLSFMTSDDYRVVIEAGTNALRFFSAAGWLTTNDDKTVSASSSSAGVLSLTTSANHGWSVGDFIFVQLSASPAADAGLYLNRLMQIVTTPTSATLTAKDDTGTAFTFDSAANALNGCTLKRVRQYTTLWGSSIVPGLRIVQASDQAVFLCNTVPPQSLPIASASGTITFGSLAAMAFRDGPYLDAQQTAPGVYELGTASGYSGSITFTPASSTFSSSDVGRLIRLFHEPATWNAGTTYTYGQTVSYQSEWWMSVASGTYASSNVGVTPGTLATVNGSQVSLWVPAPQAGRWAWGTITAQAGSSCTVSLQSNLNPANGLSITQWRLGVYTAGQYPTCGTYHDGRLVLAGAVPNRLDASVSSDKTNFAPTDIYGNVADDNAIGMVLDFDDQQSISWLASHEKGLVIGTSAGEILISSSGGITPYDREAAKKTKFLAANVEPVWAGEALLFIQLYRRWVVEYRLNDFAIKFVGSYLNETSKHLTTTGLKELAYQSAPTPILWCIDQQGGLTGLTYRRLDQGVISAAHRHQIADNGRYVASIAMGSIPTWNSDMLHLCTYASGNTDYAIEMMRPVILEV